METIRFCVFGSPVYVLDKKLQDGDSLPKWKARSWIGAYDGHSLAHSGNVPVVYNPHTTHISPQGFTLFSTINSDQSLPTQASSQILFTQHYSRKSNGYTMITLQTQDLYLFENNWANPQNQLQQRKDAKQLKVNMQWAT